MTRNIIETTFGKTGDGTPVSLFTITNANGMEACITNLGGAIVSLTAPDRNGRFADVVLGFDTLDGYLKKHPYFGVIVGRCANRIANAQFVLNGVQHTLSKNFREHHLHGGFEGFHKKLWQARVVPRGTGPCLELSYLSCDGEEGYPGNLGVTVFYSLTDDNALQIEYVATTDRDTVLNLTNHSYFNLADFFTLRSPNEIVMGEIQAVHGTPMDFTRLTPISQRIRDDYEQLRSAGGYDHNYVLNSGGKSLSKTAQVHEPTSGRVMQVFTSEPGLQFYTGNKLDGSVIGKGGKSYGKYAGLCLECQHFPNSPNVPQFPSTVLRPGERYTQTTIYQFSTR